MTADVDARPVDGPAWGRLVGAALALLPMLVRLQSPLDPLPYWDGDPLTQDTLAIGLSPALSLVGDAITLLGAALLLACAPRRASLTIVGPLVMLAAGVAACLWHLSSGGFNAKEAIAGGAWISGACAAFAFWRAASGPDGRAVRLLAFALIAGAIGLLAAKGLYQVVIEHPATVEEFKRNRDAILFRNGWSPDSAMAKAYERRLMQAEATGWFGFANVFASFGAMGVAVFGTLLVGAWRSHKEAREHLESPEKAPLLLAASSLVIAAGTLVLAGAKGGFAAAGMGLAVAAMLGWMRTRRSMRLAAFIGPAAVALPLLAVAARGVVGERIGELSLLFRWFYMQGAARIVGEHWLHGVGPDGFQAAYAAAKNPLSPEDVTSPHSLLWDWAACLGLGGIAWGLLLLWASTRIGPSANDPAPGPRANGGEPRLLMRAACLIAALAAMVAIPTQYAALLPEEALGVRIGGLVVWCVISCTVIAVADRWPAWPVALVAGACVLLAHTQIEIAGMWPQSCGALLVMVGIAAARPDAPSADGSRWPNLIAAAAMIAASACLAPAVTAAISWNARLSKAAQLVTPVRDLRRLVAGAAGHPVEQAEYQRRLATLEPAAIDNAIRTLPGEWPLSRSASQLALEESRNFASARSPAGDRYARAWALRALNLALTPGTDFAVETAGGEPITTATADAEFARLAALPVTTLDSLRAGWAATVAIGACDWLPFADRRVLLAMADRFLVQASVRDPYNPMHLQRLMDVRERLGDRAGAATAAKDLLAVNALQRLDPTVRGLSEKDRIRAERIAAAAP